MPVVYRILSTCAGMGYGFPTDSFTEAMKVKLDLIAADAGSMDPGPYYLGAGRSYAERPALKRDFSIMLRGAIEQRCPLVIGSCGMAGDTPNLSYMVEIAEEVFEEESVRDLKVALIDSHVSDRLLAGRLDDLLPLGRMARLTEGDVEACVKVAQMGIAPFITALDAGARVILAGRACDTAIFAASAVRRGIDPGLAYHAGHILECGAIACDPGSASDCLLAEFTDEGTVIFTPPNKARRATTYSIAAHSLYEEDHPAVQFYPEGVLSFKDTEYFDVGGQSAGIRNTRFFARPLTIKVEGSRKVGERYVSLLPVTGAAKVPKRFSVYGRNGVAPEAAGEREIGLLIVATSDDEEVAKSLLTLWKGFFLHFGYPERRATAGNLAFPISPSQLTFKNESGGFTSLVVGGTRDPFFHSHFERIKADIAGRVRSEYPELEEKGRVTCLVADAEEPLLFLQTVGPTRENALAHHERELRKLGKFIDLGRASFLGIYGGAHFVWGMYHLFTDQDVIKKEMFPLSLYRCSGSTWTREAKMQPAYSAAGAAEAGSGIDPAKMSAIAALSPVGSPSGSKCLIDMARVIRSKNAGVNKITYDIFFNTVQDYDTALSSGIFTKRRMAGILGVRAADVIGTYRADDCSAIKISVHRKVLSGSLDDKDIFGAQQHMKLLGLEVPVFTPGERPLP